MNIQADAAAITAALEALSPGSGPEVIRNGDDVQITWQREEPIPDAATILAVIAALPQQHEEHASRRVARRARLRTAAQSAVGKDVAALNTPERLALLPLVLERIGALDEDGNVRPLGEWT